MESQIEGWAFALERRKEEMEEEMEGEMEGEGEGRGRRRGEVSEKRGRGVIENFCILRTC